MIASALTATLLPVQAQAQIFDHYVFGEVADITATSGGLMIRMKNNAQPTTCTNTYGWMIVPNESQVLAAVVLSYWLTGRKSATVYTQPPSGSSACQIIQFDPVD
jgi:hypothetical protein